MNIFNTSKKLETINDIIRLLAYNPHLVISDSQDTKVCISLAESTYAWTEKQGGLALRLSIKYQGVIQKLGLDVEELIANPKYEQPFRIISFDKSIEKIIGEDNREWIRLKFPYEEKLIQLIRCLKNGKTNNILSMRYDGDSRVWLMPYNEIVVYYLTLIAVRYNFTICSPEIIEDFEEIRQEKQNHKLCKARVEKDSVKLINATESLQEYWEENIKPLPYIQQVDRLKDLEIYFNTRPVTSLSEALAFSHEREIFIPRRYFSKLDLLKAMQELNLFPAICMIYGEAETNEDLIEFTEWMDSIKQVDIEEKELCFGLEKDLKIEKISQESEQLIRLNKNNRQCDKNTKIIFVRNRIPKALIKSKLQIRSAFMMQDGSYWSGGSNSLTILVDNLPKRLYYMCDCPQNFKGEKITNEFLQIGNKR